MDFSAVESNLRDSFRVLARHSRAGEVREYQGVSIASAGVTFQMFNAAFLSAPVETDRELDARIEQSAVHFGARGLDWACWVCESFIPEGLRKRSHTLFRNRRMHLSVELPGMVAEELAPPRGPLPALDIRRVNSSRTRDDFCALGSTCFNVPLPWFREVFSGAEVFREFASWVGYRDDEPVSTAATVTDAGAIGVYNVGTLPGYQRRGYGEAIMRHAVEATAREHGIRRTILQSSPQGLRLYQRMGYRTVTKVVVYSS